jgi:hypothetical protein
MVKPSLAATLSLAVLAGCDAGALRNLAQTVTPPASEQQATAKDYKALEGTWYLFDGGNTQNFNPEKGTLTFVKDGNIFKGSGTFTLFGGAQKSLTQLTLTKDKPRTGTQANISIDFTVTDTKIIGKIYDENAGTTDRSAGELTGNIAEAANGSTKLDLSFVANRQFGRQPVNTVPGVTPGGGGGSSGGSTGSVAVVNPDDGGTVVNPGGGTVVNPGGGTVVNPGGGTVVNPGGGTVVNPDDGGTAPTVLPRVEEFAGRWMFELDGSPIFAGLQTGILLSPGINGGLDATVMQDQSSGSPVQIGVVTNLTVVRQSGIANLVGVLKLDDGRQLNVRYVATFISDGLNPDGRWFLKSGVLEDTPFTVTIPPIDGSGTGPKDLPNPGWLTDLLMAGDQRIAVDPGMTNPAWDGKGLRVVRNPNGTLIVELFAVRRGGPQTVAGGNLMPAGPDGRFKAEAFAGELGGKIKIEMSPPAAGDGVGVTIFNESNILLLRATLEAFGGGNQGGGTEPGLPRLEEFFGHWVFVFQNNLNPFGSLTTGVEIIPFMGGGVSARVLQKTIASSMTDVIGTVEPLFVKRMATGEINLNGQLVLYNGTTYQLQYRADYKPDTAMPGGRRLVLVSGSLGDYTFDVREVPAGGGDGL